MTTEDGRLCDLRAALTPPEHRGGRNVPMYEAALTRAEWRAIRSALAFALAGEWDEVDDETSADEATAALYKVGRRLDGQASAQD